MFGKIREKLKSFLGKSEEPKLEKAKKEKKTKIKTENKKDKTKKTLKKEKLVQENLEEEKIEDIIPEKKKGFLSKILGPKRDKITEKELEEIFQELEIILLENNVALEVVDKIKEKLFKDLINKETDTKNLESLVSKSLKESISEILIEPENIIEKIKSHKGVFTIIFFGINGSGKTTSISKLAYLLNKNGISCVLGAGDTFRAASIEQLEKHGEKLGVKVIKQTYGSDPAAVAFDTKKYAETHGIKCALIDTAGRMYTKENLIREMEKIIRVTKPDFKVFVAEAITGNDAVEQAKKFNEAIGIDGIIMTKADVDEKAGAILSAAYITGKPIIYLGVGQEYKDLKKFDKEEVIKNLGLD